MKWFAILEACRELGEPFAAMDLAESIDVAPATASGWLAKFCRWGYVRRAGSRAKQRGSRRWVRLYALTRYGLHRGEPDGAPTWPRRRRKRQYRGGRR